MTDTKHTPTSALVAVLESFTNDAGVAFIQPDTLDRVRDEIQHVEYLTARVAELEKEAKSWEEVANAHLRDATKLEADCNRLSGMEQAAREAEASAMVELNAIKEARSAAKEKSP